MAAPAAVLDAVVDGLAAIQWGDTPDDVLEKIADVREYDGEFDDDSKEFKATKPVAVLAALVGWTDVVDTTPAEVDGQFVALCIAKTARASRGETSKADVAAGLAGYVHAKLADGPDWDGLCIKAPERIRASNEHSDKLARKGLALWSVTWRQRFNLDPTPPAGTLNPLSMIFTTFAMGDEHTPDAESQIDFPEEA